VSAGADRTRKAVRGKVWLVGAGPGDPELLTVRAARLLSNARIVAYDELVSTAVLAVAPRDAERIPVGRRANGHRHHDGRIHPLIVERALAGVDVVRVKGGDPFVFGRGGEEAEELALAHIPFEVVPGISAALGAAATANIPLTHRECASSVTFATAHAALGDADLRANVTRDGTLVFYMGLARLGPTCEGLIAAGRSPATPAAIVSRASLPDARVVVATLADLPARASEVRLVGPALLIVGPVVARRVEAAPSSPPSTSA
jgi:uroporphyrin-III C-methyltransferase/precorrin-2 dehydrogenase/sirohydrochlorin ferrochelatase